MKRHLFPAVIFCLTCFFIQTSLNAQVNVSVYINSEGKDTLAESLTILESQLSKSGEVQLNRHSEDEFKGQGLLISDQPSKWPAYSKPLNKMGPEGVRVTAKDKYVVIIGNSAMAVRHGIFIYLESLGFRYYFPHPDWYIIPDQLNLFAAINYSGQPSFDHRRIWYGYGRVGSVSSDENYKFWFMANRLGGSMNAVVGHAYDDIVSRNAEIFKQHPEWLSPPLTNGVIPGNPKFDLANEALIQFLISDVFKRLEQAKLQSNPIKMVTMCPSDGTGTCNTPACRQLGTITDRVYSLINRVARAVSQKYPGTWVSGMSYSEYAEPPSKKLEPNTFVSIATAFNNTRYSTDQLIGEWSKKAGKVGIYDYLGLYVWDFDLPGRGQGSMVNRTALSIKKYYRLGAKGYDAESTPGSINKGLGHYIFSRLLWDINSDVESLRKDFFTKCFGKAGTLMKVLWDEWENYPYPEVRESDLADWIDKTDEAGRVETSPKVKKRFTHIKTYLHYLYLYNKFRASGTETDRLNLLVYSYNTFDWASFSGYPSLWVLGQASGLPGFNFNDPQAKYKKTNTLFNSAGYISQLVATDRSTLKKKENVKFFRLPKQFQKIKVPQVFNEKQYTVFKGTTFFIGPHYYVFEIKEAGDKNYLDISGGLVTGGGSGKPIALSVTAYTGYLESNQKALLQYDYIGKVDTQRFNLKKLPKGYYLLKADDPRNYFRILFSPSVSYAVIQTAENAFWGYSRYMCFYVPAGTTTFRVFKEIEAILVSPSGRKVDMSKKGNEEIDVNVLNGEAGLWMINFLNGKIHIEGIPPFLGMDPAQMLIPD